MDPCHSQESRTRISILLDIDSPYALSAEQIASFRERGFIKLADVLSDDVLDHYGREFTQKVGELNRQTRPMSERAT